MNEDNVKIWELYPEILRRQSSNFANSCYIRKSTILNKQIVKNKCESAPAL